MQLFELKKDDIFIHNHPLINPLFIVNAFYFDEPIAVPLGNFLVVGRLVGGIGCTFDELFNLKKKFKL